MRSSQGYSRPTEAAAASAPWGRVGRQPDQRDQGAGVRDRRDRDRPAGRLRGANSGSSSSGTAVAGVQVTLNQPIAARMRAPWRPAPRKLSTRGQVMAEVTAPHERRHPQQGLAVRAASGGTSEARPQIASAPASTARGLRCVLQRAARAGRWRGPRPRRRAPMVPASTRLRAVEKR